jgi:hypothetical protein
MDGNRPPNGAALGGPYIIGNTCPELSSLQGATQNAQL